ncbi:MAG: PKD domain-containing protein [Mycetocola sp.]
MRTSRAFAAGAAGAALVLALAVPTVLPTATQPTANPPTDAVLAATPDSVRFTSSGDFAANSNTAAVLTQIDSISPDFHIALGDLSYGATGAEQAWCDYVTTRVGAGFPFELLAGNHESNGQNGNINDFASCLPNQLPGAVGTYGRQYYADVPQVDPLVRYIAISPNLTFPDSTWSYAAGSARYQWTAAAIDSARAAGIPWVVVAMHKPCLSIGVYACDVGPDITNLLVTKKVDLVLSGHEHFYARTKQLSQRTGCSAIVPNTYDADCVVDSDTSMAKGAGTVFGIVGTGGQALRDVSTTDSEIDYFDAWSGLNANPAHGNLDVQLTPDTLTARFTPIPGRTFTDEFTITAGTPPANSPPTASFTAACTDLTCTADGRASSDPDGSIGSYAWDFGDGSTGTGAQPSHTYAQAGTYTIRLTVTDNESATGTTTRSVSPSDPPQQTTVASDTFERTVTNGLGTAAVGGPWSITGAASQYSVNGAARIRFGTAGITNTISLNAVSSTSTDLQFVYGSDKAASGSGTYLVVMGRRVVPSGDYHAKIVLRADGRATLALERTAAAATTVISPGIVVPDLLLAAGDRVSVRLNVTGTSPTTVQAKVWKTGTAEPAAWQRTATDTTAALQTNGGIAMSLYLSGTSTTAPVVMSIDDLIATRP